MRDDDDPSGLGQLQWGRIASVDLASGRITVALGDLETQPIRWATGGSGKTRVWTRPSVGEQVMVLAPEGDIAGAIAIRGLDCDAFPPVADPDREIVTFADGAALSYDPAARKLAVVLPAGATVSIVAPGGVTLDCDVTITGALHAAKAITSDDDVHAGTVSLKGHKHVGVQPGGGLSGLPQ